MNYISKKTILFVTAAASLLLTGCVKEVFPSNGTLTDDQVKDYPVSMLIDGIAVSMMSANTAGFYSTYGDQTDFGIPSIHLRTEYMLEDIVSVGNRNYNQFNTYVADLYMSADYQYCSYFWACYYMWIKGANDVIGKIDPNTEDAEEQKVLAQAYTFRAMFYLDLARLYLPLENPSETGYQVYGDIIGLTVPKVTEKTTEQDAINNPRVPWLEMYEFILSDLKTAEEYFEGSSDSNYLYPTLGAVYGLYARTYLEIGANYEELEYNTTESRAAYKEAARYAQLAITTSGKTPLTQAQWEDPTTGFNNGASNNSWIWGLSVSTMRIMNISNFATYMAPEATWGYGCRVLPAINNKLYEQIPEADFRKHSWLDPNWEEFRTTGNRTYKYDYKFCGDDDDISNFKSYARPYTNIKFRPATGEVSNYAVGSCSDHPLMRVEEMYFIMMEATVKSQNTTQSGITELNLPSAPEQLEEFMNQYRYTDNSYTCEATRVDDFIEEMMLQKRIEFWGEGVLMYDYKRLDLGISRSSSNFDDRFAFDTQGRSPQWNIVIPRSEIQSNAGISEYQNNPDPSGFYANRQ